jgi:hypothetical protein
MLRSTKEMMGYHLAASDGRIGKVMDFLFDDKHWTVRWMVADTGKWLPDRKVLISPVALGEADWLSGTFPVRMTRAQIENSPPLEADAPVSREYEAKWFDQLGWSYYWAGAGVWGGGLYPGVLFTRDEKEQALQGEPEKRDEVVRSEKEVMGYHIHATDGEIGHVDQFIVDDGPWTIRYMVVDTRNWLPGRKVLVPPSWIDSVHWAERSVTVDLTREGIKGSPKYDHNAPVNREYEARLYDYYGRSLYWSRE